MMPTVTWVRVEFVQTTWYELAMNVLQLSSSFTSQLFARFQSFSQYFASAVSRSGSNLKKSLDRVAHSQKGEKSVGEESFRRELSVGH